MHVQTANALEPHRSTKECKEKELRFLAPLNQCKCRALGWTSLMAVHLCGKHPFQKRIAGSMACRKSGHQLWTTHRLILLEPFSAPLLLLTKTWRPLSPKVAQRTLPRSGRFLLRRRRRVKLKNRRRTKKVLLLFVRFVFTNHAAFVVF